MSKNVKGALNWIVSILRKNKIPFQITGGLAARIYGSKRPLADIDIELLNKDILILGPIVKGHIIYGPKIYKDKNFQLELMTLNYNNQKIDLCGIKNQKIFNKKIKKWQTEKINLKNASVKKIYKKFLPVISIKNLINYKSKLKRRVDLEDINNLLEN